MDALRFLAVAISLGEVCVLVGYFVPLTNGVPFWTWVGNHSAVRSSDWDGNYVSDLLFESSVYRQLVTSLVALHLVVCAIFVVRLNWRVRGSWILVFELCLMALSWIGWAVLTADYHTETGMMSNCHFVGTALFTFSGLLYFPAMAYNVYERFPRQVWTALDDFVFLLAIASFLFCLGAAVYFIDTVLHRSQGFAWIFEHLAFILFFAAHLFLFVLEGLVASDCAVSEEGMRGVRITELCIED